MINTLQQGFFIMQDSVVTQQQLNSLEKVLDQVFAKIGIDVEFTRHFLDRVNDERNRKQITVKELALLFKKEFQRWGKEIAKLGPDAEAVMKDLESDINIPFALKWNGRELEMIAKTVMRKPNFKTSNKEFPVESTAKSFVKEMRELLERELTPGEKRSREAHVKKLKKHKGDFEKRYGKDAESVMYGVATKRAKGESVEENDRHVVPDTRFTPGLNKGPGDKAVEDEHSLRNAIGPETQLDDAGNLKLVDKRTKKTVGNRTYATKKDAIEAINDINQKWLEKNSDRMPGAWKESPRNTLMIAGADEVFEDIDMKPTDHEVEMAKSDLYNLAKNSIALYELIQGVSEAEGLEGWQQGKITQANDYITSVYQSMSHDMTMKSAKHAAMGESGEKGVINELDIMAPKKVYVRLGDGSYKLITFRSTGSLFGSGAWDRAMGIKVSDVDNSAAQKLQLDKRLDYVLQKTDGTYYKLDTEIQTGHESDGGLPFSTPDITVYDINTPEWKSDVPVKVQNALNKKLTESVTKKRWKQTSMSPAAAAKEFGKENVRVKKGALRNGDDMVEVFVESTQAELDDQMIDDAESMSKAQFVMRHGDENAHRWDSVNRKSEGAMKRIATTQSSKTDRMASTDKQGLETYKKRTMEELDDETVDQFHRELDNLVHKFLGHSSDEMEESIEENVTSFTNPNFDVEWEEAERYPEFVKIGKAKWIELAKTGKPIDVDNALSNKIENTEAGEQDRHQFDNLEEPKKERFRKAVEAGTVELPIIARYSDGYLELVAGNTRLTGMMREFGKGKAWIFDVPDEVAELAEDNVLKNVNERKMTKKAAPKIDPDKWAEYQASKKKPKKMSSTQKALADIRAKTNNFGEAHPNDKRYDDCWDGYEKVPGMKRGEKGSCRKISEEVILEDDQDFHEEFGYLGYSIDENDLFEAEYQGRKVQLNKPIRTGKDEPKKFKVYVKDGDKVKLVRFGHQGKGNEKTMSIKKDDPERRKNFRARHNCDNPGPKTKARYWSCKAW